MKAIVGTKYGSPDILQLKETAKPTPKTAEAFAELELGVPPKAERKT